MRLISLIEAIAAVRILTPPSQVHAYGLEFRTCGKNAAAMPQFPQPNAAATGSGPQGGHPFESRTHEDRMWIDVKN